MYGARRLFSQELDPEAKQILTRGRGRREETEGYFVVVVSNRKKEEAPEN
jgi:hypothetical protein